MLLPHQVLGFLHDERKEVRGEARSYLRQAVDSSPLTAEDLLRTFPDEAAADAAKELSCAEHFQQTPDSVALLLDMARRRPSQSVLRTIEQALLNIHMDLLPRVHATITACPAIHWNVRRQLDARMHLQSIPTDQLWKRVADLARADATKPSDRLEEDVDSTLRALGQRPEAAQRAIDWLTDPSIDDSREVLAAEALGWMRHLPAASVLLDAINTHGRWDEALHEACTLALSRIGDGEAVVNEIVRRWPTSSAAFRSYAPEILERIKRPDAEEALVELLDRQLAQHIPQEASSDEKREIDTGTSMAASSLCSMCPTQPRAFELLVRTIEEDRYQVLFDDLTPRVLAVAAMADVTLPNADQLGKNSSQRRTMDAFRQHFRRLFEERAAHMYEADAEEESRSALRRGAARPGRNDPCPCGSRKKYKKCCGK